MNKAELISDAAKRCGRPQTIVKECLDAMLCVISEELTRGGEVKIMEFGRLYNKEKEARMMKIPCGKTVEIPSRRIVRFKAYSHFNLFSSKY